MVDLMSRIDAADRHLNNTFMATLCANDVSEVIAQEVEAYAQMLIDNGDPLELARGLVKAVEIIRSRRTEDGLT